jgi:hypothetical protein
LVSLIENAIASLSGAPNFILDGFMNIFFGVTFDDEKARIAFCPEEIRRHGYMVHQRSFRFSRWWTWSVEELVLQFELDQVGLQNLLLVIFWNSFDDWAGSLFFEAWALALKLELVSGLLLSFRVLIRALIARSQFTLKLKKNKLKMKLQLRNLRLKVGHSE